MRVSKAALPLGGSDECPIQSLNRTQDAGCAQRPAGDRAGGGGQDEEPGRAATRLRISATTARARFRKIEAGFRAKGVAPEPVVGVRMSWQRTRRGNRLIKPLATGLDDAIARRSAVAFGQ